MAINSDGGLTDLAIISIFFTVMEMKSTKLISANVVSITVFENYKKSHSILRAKRAICFEYV